MGSIQFEIRIVSAGTGADVFDHPSADHLVQKFLPPDRRHGPMVGVVQLGGAKPTPGVLRDVVITMGEDIKAGRYGDFSLVISSEDEDTRHVIGDIAKAHDVALFVSSSTMDFSGAIPVGSFTGKDRETLDHVLSVGGTVSATELSRQLDVEHTTASNRLVSLHRKGFLQRIGRPHPEPDLFVDPRSIQLVQ